MMPENSVRPPEYPKPSNAQGVISQNRLKNRLLMGWHKKEHAKLIDAAEEEQSVIIKGYGEKEFDKEESVDFKTSVLGSTWSEQVTQSIVSKPYTGNKADLVSRRSLTIGSTIPGSLIAASQARQSVITTSVEKTPVAPVSNLKSHLNMSQVYQVSGWEQVAERMAFGNTEFCYVTEDPNEYYKFRINETVPMGLKNNDYVTVSRHGILHSTPEGTELMPFSELVRDQALYNKLRQIHVIGRFRVWKSFLLWRQAVKGLKFISRGEQLSESLCLLSPFYQRLLSTVTEQCAAIKDLNALQFSEMVVYDMDSYLQLQRSIHKQSKETREQITKELFSFLAREGEVQAYAIMNTTPVVSTVKTNLHRSTLFIQANQEASIAAAAAATAQAAALVAAGGYVQQAPGKGRASTIGKHPHAPHRSSTLSHHPPHHSSVSHPSKGRASLISTTGAGGGGVGGGVKAEASVTSVISTTTGSKRPFEESLGPLNPEGLSDTGPAASAASTYAVTIDSLSSHIYATAGAAGFKSMLAGLIPQMNKISHTEKASIRINCRKLAAFLHLVDFMIRDALYDSIEIALGSLETTLVGKVIDAPTNGRSGSILRNSPHKLKNTEPVDAKDFHLLMKSALTFDNNAKVNVGRITQAMFLLSVELKQDTSHAAPAGANAASTEETGTRKRHKAIHSTADDYLSLDMLQSSMRHFTIGIDPNKNFVLERFETVLNETLQVGSYTEGAYQNQQCIDVLQCIASELPTNLLEDVIFLDKTNTVSELKNSCLTQLSSDFDACMSHVLKYRFMCVQYEKNAKTLSQSEVSKLHDMSPEQMIAELNDFEVALTDCGNIIDYQDVGVFRLNFQPFKKKIIAMINKCKQQFYRLIPDLYVASGDKFYAELSKLNDILSSNPQTLEAYAKVVDAFNKATADDRLQSTYLYITAVREILESHKLPKTEAVIRQNLTINLVWTNFNKLMGDFDDTLAETNAKFLKHLTARTKTLLDPIDRGRDLLMRENVNNPTSDPDTILLDLMEMKKQMEGIRKKGLELERIQEILKFDIFSKEIITNMLDDLNNEILLWSIVKLIKELQVSFRAVNFQDAESEEIERQLRYAAVTVTQKIQKNNSKVMNWLLEALAELQMIAPIIKKLQSNTQRATHIQRIQKILGRNIFDDQVDTTVGELVDVVNICAHVAELDEIYEESLFQYNLECTVKDLVKACDEREFSFDSDRETKSLIYFSNLEELSIFFEDIMITLNACISSTFSTPHLELFTKFQNVLQNCIDMNTNIGVIQEGYMRIRVLFTSARTARYLSQSLKHFKLLDEMWRKIILLSKTDVRVVHLYSSDRMKQDIGEALNSIKAIDQCMKNYVAEQCLKWPKLYLLEQNDLFEVFATQDPKKTFHKCRVLFPAITDVNFDEAEAFYAISINSNEEVVEFKKPCSARKSLVDWLKSIDASLSEKLEEDIREYCKENRAFVEDLRNPRTCEQSRLCYVQIKFWSSLVDSHGRKIPNSGHILNLKLQELVAEMMLFTNTMVNYTVKYQIKTMANLLTVFIQNRDLLQLMIANAEGDDSEATFAFESAIKKIYNPMLGTITVKQGPFKSAYGMKYAGFHNRLVITPLTDKCFLAISTALSNTAFPVLRGPAGQGKQSTLSALTYELGQEAIHFDCRQFRKIDTLFDLMRAVLGVGSWLSLTHMESLNSNMMSVFLTVLSTVQSALVGGLDRVYMAGDLVDISLNPAPKICLVFSSAARELQNSFIPASVRHQFRPICFNTVSRKVMLSVLLQAHCFGNVPKVACKLDGVCDYVVTHKLLSERVILSLISEAIRVVGYKNERTPAAVGAQMLSVTQTLFSTLPPHIQDKLSEVDFRFICNLFLEVIYNHESDFGKFKPNLEASRYEEELCSRMNQSPLPIVVVGATAVGKTRLIRTCIDKVVEDHNAEVDRIESNKFYKKPPVPLARYHAHKRTITPFVMADFIPEIRPGESYRRSLGHSSGSGLALAAEAELERAIVSVDPAGPVEFMHFDTQSSLQLATLVSRAQYLTDTKARQIKFVWESVELAHLDPATASSVSIVMMRERTYTVEDIIEEHMHRMAEQESKAFRLVMGSCIETYIKPCIKQFPEESYVTEFAIVDNLFHMLESMYAASGITSKGGVGNKWHEDSVRRLVIYCCIWTFGVSTAYHKETFDSWFKDYFEADCERMKDRNIYPDYVGRSIYESFLHQPNESKVDLEWCVFNMKSNTSLKKAISNSAAAGGLNTSEERLNSSYANLYYSTIFHGSEGGASLLIPTPTAKAFSYIQACLMKTGGHVLVTGAKGTGKSSLLRELIELSKTITSEKSTLETAARWVCRVTDCGPKTLQQHMDRCKSSLYPKLMERKLSVQGAVFIEDVNIKMHTANNFTCAEMLRSVFESGEMYNIERKIWQDCQNLYTLISSDNTHGFVNGRFVRHNLILCCEFEELRNVFIAKIQRECPTLRDEMRDDLVKITFIAFDSFRRTMRDMFNSETKEFECMTRPDQLFVQTCYNRSVASTVDCILSLMTRSINTIGQFTANDAVRVWDRIIADYTVRHEVVTSKLSLALDTASSEHSYAFPSFCSIVEREKVIRTSAHDALVAAVPAGQTLERPVSYLKNASGFFKSGFGVFSAVVSAESVRDSYLKRFGAHSIPLGLDGKSLALWTDVQNAVAHLTLKSLSGNRRVYCMTGYSPYHIAKVNRIISQYCDHQFKTVVVKPADSLPRGYFAALYDTNQAPAAAAAASSVSQQVPHHLEVSEVFLEHFLTDRVVLKQIKKHMTAIFTDVTSIVHDRKVLSSGSFTAKELLLIETVDDIIAGLTSYDSIEESEMVSTLWQLNISDKFAKDLENWEELLENMELRSSFILHSLSKIGAYLDPRINLEMRVILENFLNRQKFVFTCQSLEMTYKSLQVIHNLPRFCSLVHSIHLYDTYAGNSSVLVEKVGDVLADKIQTLLSKHTEILVQRLNHHNFTDFANTVGSLAYRTASIDFLVAQYKLLSDENNSAEMSRIAGGIFEAHKTDTSEKGLSSLYGMLTTVKNEENEAVLQYNPIALGCAVYNTVYARYLSVLTDELKENEEKTFAALSKDLMHLELHVIYGKSQLLSLLPLATAILLNAKFEASQEYLDEIKFERMRALLVLIGGLPEVSHLKRYLTSLALVLLTSQECAVLVDQSVSSFFLLNDLLGIDLINVTYKAEDIVHTSDNNAIHSTVSLNSFTVDYSHIAIDPQAPTAGILKIEQVNQFRSLHVIPKAAADCCCMFIITPQSVMISELMALHLLKTNLVFQTYPMLCKVWRAMASVHANCLQPNAVIAKYGVSVKAVLLSFEVNKYVEQYQECLSKLQKGMRILGTLLQGIKDTKNLANRIMIGVWYEFTGILSSLLTDVSNVDVDREISVAVFQLLQKLRDLVSDKDWCSMMISTLLNLYIDTSSPSGSMASAKILQQLRLSKGEKLGILPIPKKIDASTDDNEGKAASAEAAVAQRLRAESGDDLHEADDEDEVEEEFRLSDASKTLMRMALLFASQAVAAPSACTSLVNIYALNPTSIATSSIVVSNIEKNLQDWVEWAADIYSVEMPSTGNYRTNWLDKLIIAFLIKPCAVPNILMNAVVSLGLTVPYQPDQSNTYQHLSMYNLAIAGSKTDGRAVVAVYNSGSGGNDILAGSLVSNNVECITCGTHVFLSSDARLPGYRTAGEMLAMVRPSQQELRQLQRKKASFMNHAVQHAAQTNYFATTSSIEAAIHSAVAAVEDSNSVAASRVETIEFVHGVIMPYHSSFSNLANEMDVSRLLSCVADTRTAVILEQNDLLVSRFNTNTLQSVNLNKEVLDPDVLSTSRLDRVYSSIYKLPVIAQITPFEVYGTLLGHFYHTVRNIPLRCAPIHRVVVYRIRWILLLFHTSVRYKLRHDSEAFVGKDTLAYAFTVVDQLFAHESTDTVLSPTHASHAGTRVGTSHQPNKEAAFAAAAAAGVTAASSSRDEGDIVEERELTFHDYTKEQKEHLTLTLDMLVHYLADSIYCEVVGWSTTLKDSIKSTFQSFFTPSSCDPHVTYFIENKVAVPSDFEYEAALSFFRQINELVDNKECTYIDLVGTSISDVNSQSLMHLYDAMDGLLSQSKASDFSAGGTAATSVAASVVPSTALHHHDKEDHEFLSTHTIDTTYNKIDQKNTMLRIQHTIQQLLSLMPEKIRTDTKEVQEKMTVHQLNIEQKVAERTSSYFESKRRQKLQRSVVKQTREFDPLWAFLLTECFEFNKAVDSLKTQATDLLHCQTSLIHHLMDHHMDIAEEGVALDALVHLAVSLEQGFVPDNWLNQDVREDHRRVRVDEWMDLLVERREMLQSWLLAGYPGVLKLHLLRNPAGLFQALKEMYTLKTEATIDKTGFHFTVVDPATINISSITIMSTMNFGCNVLLSGVHLHNAGYNYKSNTLEFLTDFSASRHGQKIILQVSTTHEQYDAMDEEYACPLFVQSDFPSATDLFSEKAPIALSSCTIPLMLVPLETTEDTEDCNMSEVALYCCSKWRLPV